MQRLSRATRRRKRLLLVPRVGPVAFLLLIAGSLAAETLVDGRRSAVLESERARLVIDLLGGSIVGFQLRPDGLNPLVWRNDGPTDEARSMSHFVCLDRWGQPSAAEAANGMPGHGEATKVAWQTLEEDGLSARMAAELPMAGLRIERSVRLGSTAWFEVEETVTNQNKLGRMYNFVQHPTIGPPFLDESVLVDSNARRGFMQSSPLPNPEEPHVWWPQALQESSAVDMRRLHHDPMPNVVSYVIDQETGWTTAANPGKGLLIGYIWETSDYPWLNMWRHVQDGKPLARGLEFGTTGLHQPFPILAEKGRIFGRRLFRYLDAGASQTRGYLAFLLEIPQDFSGVANVEREGRTLRVTERAPTGRVLLLELE